MTGNKGLRRAITPTQSSYRNAVAEIIRTVQGDLTDAELADRLGCSSGTIGNARNRKGNLCGVTLAKIGHEFGPDALAAFAALFDCIVIPRESKAANDLATIAGLSHVAGDWIERLRDGQRCHNDTIALANALRPLLTALGAVVEEAEKHRSAA